MNFTQFLQWMKDHPRMGWRLNKAGMVRCKKGWCPLKVWTRSDAYADAAARRGMALSTICKVVEAADKPWLGSRAAVRMRRAVGLQ